MEHQCGTKLVSVEFNATGLFYTNQWGLQWGLGIRCLICFQYHGCPWVNTLESQCALAFHLEWCGKMHVTRTQLDLLSLLIEKMGVNLFSQSQRIVNKTKANAKNSNSQFHCVQIWVFET